MVDYIIRKATKDDLDSINALVSAHKEELGFVRQVTLVHSTERQEISVAEISVQIVGLVRYHHRRDLQTTLYDIVVSPARRLTGIGKALVQALAEEALILGKQVVVLKCPAELQANAFYAHIGFERWAEEPGKRRKLVVWHLPIASPKKYHVPGAACGICAMRPKLYR